MSNIVFKQVAQANLPSSAPPEVLIFTTDTGRIYRGTGTGLTMYSSILTFTESLQFPSPGDPTKLYLAVDSRLLYYWDNNSGTYIVIDPLSSFPLLAITGNIVLTEVDNRRCITTSNIVGPSATITLPMPNGDLMFQFIHESFDKEVTLTNGTFIIPGVGVATSLKLQPKTFLELRDTGSAWRVSRGIDGLGSGFAFESFMQSDLISNKLIFKHRLGFKYIDIIIYNEQGEKVGSPDYIKALDGDTSEIGMESLCPISGAYTAVAILGGASNLTESSNVPCIYDATQVYVAPDTEPTALTLDYIDTKSIQVTLDNDVVISLKKLQANSSRIIHLIIVQNATAQKSVTFADASATIGEVWTEYGQPYISPEAGEVDLLTFVWDGVKFIYKTMSESIAPVNVFVPGVNAGMAVLAGGFWNDLYLNTADKFDFETEELSTVSDFNLQLTRRAPGGIGKSDYGVMAGGYVGNSVTTAEKIDWDLGTAYTPSFNLSQARYGVVGLSRDTYGLFVGGSNNYLFDPVPVNVTDKTIWATELTLNAPSYSLTTPRSFANGCVNAGYAIVIGGKDGSGNVLAGAEQIDWTLETASVLGSMNLTTPRFNFAAVSNNLFGLIAGGYGTTYLSSLEKIDFVSNVTIPNPGMMLLSQERLGLVGAGNGTYAIFAGGETSGAISVALIDKTTYATEVTEVLGSYQLSHPKRDLGVVCSYNPF